MSATIVDEQYVHLKPFIAQGAKLTLAIRSVSGKATTLAKSYKALLIEHRSL